MKKTAYILGSLEIIIGILLLCVNTIIRNIEIYILFLRRYRNVRAE